MSIARFTIALMLSSFASLYWVSAEAAVLYRYGEMTLFDGKFGPIADIQAAAAKALSTCGRTETITADGEFGPGTRNAFRALAGCPSLASQLNGDVDANNGAMTDALWKALLGATPVPSVDGRAHTLMLTYEDTDYVRMEWNFCQSSPLYNPAVGKRVCYSNDPKSYLTWGPNGATAGGGREVQLILSAVDRADPALIDDNFGSEAQAVRRMFKLRDRDAERSLETYLCGIWADPGRRAAWKAGFAQIGRIPTVRETFDRLYKSSSLDGGKIASFYRAYAANHLTPTEIDYGFFKDRAAHTSVQFETVRRVIATFLGDNPAAKPWQIRQAISLHVRPSNQSTDRLGRDVAFYIDAGRSSLSAEELSAWRARGRLKASDAGLSDDRTIPDFTPEPRISTDIAQPETLTRTERLACPRPVLDVHSR